MAIRINLPSEDILKQSNLTGKMFNIPSLSTSPMNNSNCIKNRKIKNSICSGCYAVTGCKMYSNLDKMLLKNSETLSKKQDFSEFKTNTIYYRFESHGDLINSEHLDNLVRIAKNNPQTKFALWTKVYKITEKYFSIETKPKNLQVLYSSLMKNKQLNINKFKYCDKIFTVYEKQYVKNNDIKINCGSKDCFGCGLCYNKNSIQYITELKK